VPVTVVPVGGDGVLDPDGVGRVLGPDVAMVSVMWVNNEVGTIQPVREIAARARAAGALFHTDAIQAVGKLPVDVREAGVDLLSLAGHKFRGPLGAAALWVRRRVRILPMIHGGHQERARRAGTENLPAIVGLGVAAARASERLGTDAPARLEALGERLREGLAGAVPGVRLNGDEKRRLATIVNVSFEGVDGEAVLHELDREGISVSTGSACSAAAPGPSHVLVAMGRSAEDAHASVRFSLGDGNDEADVETILTRVPPVVARLRALSGSHGAAAPEERRVGSSAR